MQYKPSLDTESFTLEWWNGKYWETSKSHEQITWESWLTMRDIIRRDWVTKWRLVGHYIKEECERSEHGY